MSEGSFGAPEAGLRSRFGFRERDVGSMPEEASPGSAVRLICWDAPLPFLHHES